MPTPERVEQAIAEIHKRHANYVYFFERNQSPDWIEPLAAKGFFKHPIAPEDHGDGSRSFPIWPESQYLVRMAPKAPELVTNTLLGVPYTENVFIHGDIVAAALALPGPQAAALSAAERKWIRSQRQLLWLLPHRHADLVVHLAEEGEVEEAFRLAQTLLEVLPDPRWATAKDEERLFVSKETLARMTQWDYQEAVRKIAPALQAGDPLRTIKLFADLLQNAMSIAEPPRENDYSDNSYVWRPAIEHHAQNQPDHSIRDVLVAATRDSAEAAGRTNPEDIPRVVDELESRKRAVFRRIALHLLAELGESAPDLATSRLTSWENFDDIAVRHEYARVAQAHFKNVRLEDREQLLEHLRNKPPLENFRRNFASMYGRDPTPEEIEQTHLGIELRRLAIVKDDLPDKWKARYEALVEQLGGAPAHPDFSSYSDVRSVGLTSPKEAEELAAMDVEALIEFLRTWRPPAGERFADSYDGLGRQLTAAVAAEPERFAPYAERYRELEPTYARALIDGFEQALGANLPFDWGSVLKLGAFIVAQPLTETEADHDVWEDRDPGWRWARGSVAHLIGEGVGRTDQAMVPIAYRDEVWAILAPLAADAEPTPEHEARYGGSNMDPLTLSINTNRGKAMHAVIRYALWVRRDDESAHPERIVHGLDAMPEVREVLDAHLNPQADPSPAIRAVYGERLPWLVLLDPRWVTDNLNQIFPTAADAALLREAAWETYLANSPYDNAFDVLKGEYHRAVSELEEIKAPTDRRRFLDPAERVAEHLMILYWRGRITWDNEGDMLQEFFERAAEEVRAQALEFVGHSLWRGEYDLSAEQAARLRELWRRRWETIRAVPDAHRKEGATFGWWFASSRKLPDDWLLQQLLEILEAGFAPDADHLVIAKLAELAPAKPYEAARAARLLVAVKPEAHFLSISDEPLRRVVGVALASEEERAKQEARDLLNDLAARGYRALDDVAAEL